MSILQSNWRIVTDQIRLSTTSPTSALSQTYSNPAIIENIRVVNIGAGTPTVTIDKFDGTTAYVLKQAYLFGAAGSATDVLELNQQTVLNGNWTIRFTRTGGSTNDLHVFVTYGLTQSARTP